MFKIRNKLDFEGAVRSYKFARANAAFLTNIMMEAGLDRNCPGIWGTRRIRKKRLKKAFVKAALENVLDQLEPQ